MIRRWRNARALTLALVVGVLAGCAGTPEQKEDFEPPVYPPPPDEARYIFEMTLISSAQVTPSTASCSEEAIGTPQAAMMASPINLSI